MTRFIQCPTPQHDIRDELKAGLIAEHAAVSPKYLYDALGSKLFEAICELPEYYPTRTEAGIFAAHAEQIAASVGRGATLIDLGAGNCAKAAKLFSVLKPSQYVPIDISVDFLQEAASRLQTQFPEIDMVGIGMDFSSDLNLPDAVNGDDRLFFYPGSSIGNFTPEEALAFLKRVRQACLQDDKSGGKSGGSGILIGVDLVKEKGVLDVAYDDALGVTAAFNLNLLRNLNHLLGADFELRAWRHRGFFNVERSRIEMHLESEIDQIVSWAGGERQFARGERIHTENSYKYTKDSFVAMLRQAGFGDVAVWTDPAGWFLVCHARAA